MLGLKLNHVSKRGYWSIGALERNVIESIVIPENVLFREIYKIFAKWRTFCSNLDV